MTFRVLTFDTVLEFVYVCIVSPDTLILLPFFSQRKETLLKEYKLRNKSSKFIDRRFGEYDTKMAPEDKILQRFAMERKVSDVNIIPPRM